MAAASSSASPQEKYDVFLSFRGEDTRHNFTSHLHAALCQKQIKTFIDDEELKTGDQISPSLLNAIEHSRISLIVFSPGYASSRWCLEELEKILQCKNNYVQIVIPVFYGVYPSDVRNQIGTFGDAFTKLEKRFKGCQETLQRWRTALREAANLSGFDSNVIRVEATLVKKVVEDIFERLNEVFPLIENKNLVGVDSRIEYIEWQLLIGFRGVRKIGIWGIGGIGKTTLADAVFNKISRHFESSYFVKNIREESEKNKELTDLHTKLICAILKDKHVDIRSTFTKRRLACKKVLIVFDDVTDLKQIKSLIGHFENMGSGSRFIITTRDKQVLKNCEVDYTYETEILSNDVALELFSLHAFKQNLPPKDFMELSERVLSYVKGVPLALEVLGSSLFGKTKRQWESYVNRLSNILDLKIREILKVSYDGLNSEEQQVFLDVACFFKGYNRDLIQAILDGCGFNSLIDINVLIERSLITASSNTITMHDLLQEMGRDIVRQESPNDPGQRSWLWDHEDIISVLTNNTGTRAIRGMRLHMSKVRQLRLQPKSFKKMHNLRFLEVCGCTLHGFEVLKSDFSELRYLSWYGYSANSLPPNFNPKNLVAIYMRYSKVKQLWNGDQKLDKLKHIDLSYSNHLLTMPDLSLIPNLESLILEGCTYLSKSFKSICNLNKLVLLNLRECKSFKKLLINSHSKCLRELILSDCSDLEMVPFVPCTVEVLLLDGTAIKELPSLEHLVGLIKLSLKNCSRLECLPENICELKCLRYLYLSDCSKLDRLPNGLGNLKALEELEMEGLAIKDIPSSIKCLNNLKKLNLFDCRIEELPNNLGKLRSLKYLYLGGNKFETLPVSIKDLHCLFELDVSNCQKLKSLPELPDRLKIIEAHSCTSLEAVSGLSTPGHFELPYSYNNFTDCFNTKFHALPYLTSALANLQRAIIAKKNFGLYNATICYPGSEIPEWFSFKSTDSFIKLPVGWLNDNLIGFVFCAVVSFSNHQEYEDLENALVVNGKSIFCSTMFAELESKVTESDHVCIKYDCGFMFYELLTLSLNNEAYIQFFVKNRTMQDTPFQFNRVKKCGIKLVYAEDNELRRGRIVEREQRLNSINCSPDDCFTCCVGYCLRHVKFGISQFGEILDRWTPHPVYQRIFVSEDYISEEKVRRFPCQSDG